MAKHIKLINVPINAAADSAPDATNVHIDWCNTLPTSGANSCGSTCGDSAAGIGPCDGQTSYIENCVPCTNGWSAGLAPECGTACSTLGENYNVCLDGWEA